ncbi:MULTISPECIES: hypothetical protein [Alphaproteobacteria]|nr:MULTISPECIES: hypothetical protein [Rhodospirillales]
MERQELTAILASWQAGEIGYRDAMGRSGIGSLFGLYEAARQCNIPLRKDLLPREERAVALATMDLLGERPVNTHDVLERFKTMLRRLVARAAARGIPLDTTDLVLRRRIYRAAKRIEKSRARRGDDRPYLDGDDGPAPR